mgnify:FL=1
MNFNAPIHHYGFWKGTDPHCTTEGQRTRACKDDGCGHTEEMTLPARGHYFDGGRVTTPPTETTTGVRTYTCKTYGCNATYTEEIPKLAPQVPVSERFNDVDPDGWAYEDIAYCVEHSLMSGVGGTTFLPDGVMTRAQIVQVLYNIEGEPAVTGSTPFTDLTSDWYQNAVLWAYQTGVVAGTSDTTFDPESPVTREQIAVILMGYAEKVLGLDFSADKADLTAFPDGASVSDWARDAVAEAVALGLISGAQTKDGTFLQPQGGATREQAATILMGFYSLVDVDLRMA